MKTYMFFVDEQGDHVAIKKGWSWPAFLFAFLWAWCNKLWMIGTAMFIAGVIGNIVIVAIFGERSAAGGYVFLAMVLLMQCIFGASGNEWLTKAFGSRKGYRFVGEGRGNRPKEALSAMAKEMLSASEAGATNAEG